MPSVACCFSFETETETWTWVWVIKSLGKILGLKGQDQDGGYAKIVTKISTKIEDWNGLLRVCQGQGVSRSRSNRPKPSRTEPYSAIQIQSRLQHRLIKVKINRGFSLFESSLIFVFDLKNPSPPEEETRNARAKRTPHHRILVGMGSSGEGAKEA